MAGSQTRALIGWCNPWDISAIMIGNRSNFFPRCGRNFITVRYFWEVGNDRYLCPRIEASIMLLARGESTCGTEDVVRVRTNS